MEMLANYLHQKLILKILIQNQILLINSLRIYKYLTTLSNFGLVRSIGGLTFSPM